MFWGVSRHTQQSCECIILENLSKIFYYFLFEAVNSRFDIYAYLGRVGLLWKAVNALCIVLESLSKLFSVFYIKLRLILPLYRSTFIILHCTTINDHTCSNFQLILLFHTIPLFGIDTPKQQINKSFFLDRFSNTNAFAAFLSMPIGLGYLSKSTSFQSLIETPPKTNLY